MRETDPEFGLSHDRWLAGYHRGRRQVWCSNPDCVLHRDGAEIDTETEYGQTSLIPEECPVCRADWLDDPPSEEEEEEMMHPASQATIGEYVCKIIDYGKKQGSFNLSISRDESGEYSTAFVFGEEAEDSPMAAGASYGIADTAAEAFSQIVKECRL